MTKVKVDVQIVVTGGVGDGKTVLLHRILRAIREDKGLQSICKIHPGRSFDTVRSEQAGLSFDGELLQSENSLTKLAELIKIQRDSTDGGDQYMRGLLNGMILSESVFTNDSPIYMDPPKKAGPKALKDTEVNVFINQPKTEPLKVFVDPITGVFRKIREGERINETCVVTLLTATLTDAPADPVGMDQIDDALASTQASASQPGSVMASGGYVDRCVMVKPVISGMATMERLPGESDADYRNRNKLPNTALIPPYVNDWSPKTETETGAPEPHAHTKAAETYRMFSAEAQSMFKTNPMDGAPVYPCGLVAGNNIQVITTEGNVLFGEVVNFHWNITPIGPVVKYYRKL